MRIAFLCGALALLVAARPASAQDTTRGVRIGLTFAPGTKPGVVVLPIAGAAGDSVRAILARDFDYSDRIEVIGREGTSSFDAAQNAGSAVNYGLWKSLGAAVVVQGQMTGGGVNVALHDVARETPVAASRETVPEVQALAPMPHGETAPSVHPQHATP